MARYLVTGGAGFIGSHLVEVLTDAGHGVRVFDDLSNGAHENLVSVPTPVEVHLGDVRDVDQVAAAARGVDGVFHLAALGSVPRSFADPASTFAVNVGGTETVIEAARAEGVPRVVLASSSSVYGAGPSSRRRETDTPAPASPYGESKLAAEQACLAASARGGPASVCLRYFNAYGPRQDPHSPYAAVIPRFISRLLAGEPPVVYGDGDQTRDFTYVADIVSGTVAAMETPGAAGHVLNLGAGRGTSVNRLLSAICAIVGSREQAVHAPGRPGEPRHSEADVTVAYRLLGYSPRWALPEGLQATVAWHREQLAARRP